MRKAMGLLVAGMLAAVAAPAMAQDAMPPEAYMPTLEVFFTGLAETHALVLACAKDKVEDDWTRAAGLAEANLWSGGYPADFIFRVRAIFAAPPATNVDCSDAQAIGDAAWQAVNGWGAIVLEATSGSLGLEYVGDPIEPERMARTLAVLREERALQARNLECVAVVRPMSLPSEVGVWTRALSGIRYVMQSFGFDRSVLGPELDASEANVIWQPVAAEAREALRAECLADAAWMERFSTMETQRLALRMEAAMSADDEESQ